MTRYESRVTSLQGDGNGFHSVEQKTVDYVSKDVGFFKLPQLTREYNQWNSKTQKTEKIQQIINPEFEPEHYWMLGITTPARRWAGRIFRLIPYALAIYAGLVLSDVVFGEKTNTESPGLEQKLK